MYMMVIPTWRVHYTTAGGKEWSLACSEDDVETLIRVLLFNHIKSISATKMKSFGEAMAPEAVPTTTYTTTRNWHPDFSKGQTLDKAIKVALMDGTLVES
jgi:hypothetical protein